MWGCEATVVEAVDVEAEIVTSAAWDGDDVRIDAVAVNVDAVAVNAVAVIAKDAVAETAVAQKNFYKSTDSSIQLTLQVIKQPVRRSYKTPIHTTNITCSKRRHKYCPLYKRSN